MQFCQERGSVSASRIATALILKLLLAMQDEQGSVELILDGCKGCRAERAIVLFALGLLPIQAV